MSNISSELHEVRYDELGDDVRNAIADAMEILDKNSVDISYELYFIRNGRYGRDIRMSIHDALYKLSMNVPENVWPTVIGIGTITS